MGHQTNDSLTLADVVAEASSLLGQEQFERAEELLKSLPASQRNDPAVRAQRAVLDAQLGRLDQAESALRTLLRDYPRADLACNLGLVLIGKGQDARALDVFINALGMPSCPPVAHKHAGRLLLRSNQPLLALEHFRALQKSQAPNAENLADLGFALLANGETHDAEPVFREALQIDDRSSVAWHGLGQALQNQNRIDQAIAAYQRALEFTEETLPIEVDLAILYETSNQPDSAIAVAEEILQRYPGEPHAMLVKARCLRRSGDAEKAATLLAKLLSGKAASPQQRSTCHHLLGRIADADDRSDEAFRHFELGNEIAAGLVGATDGDDEPYVKHANQVRRWATATRLAQLAGSGEIDDGHPVFLIGFPRSGTTLLDQLIDAHPNCQVMEEKPAVTAMQRHFRTRHAYPEDIVALDGGEVEVLRSVYFEFVARHLDRAPDKILIDKLPLNITAVPFIQKVFPGARFIVALRHPCDVVLSCFMQEFSPNVATMNFFSLERIARLYAAVMGLWQTVSILPLNAHLQKYEDLVDDFETQARSLVAFLGLDFEPEILRFPEHAKRRGQINTPSYDQVSQPLYEDARFRWTRYRKQLEPVLPVLLPFIEDFSYES